ncbi:Ldh family oxidoreductase [Virgibacillus salexigens]|uniref:Ldh family oxidoreductase n=1 Tax=Virgibacillus salexigens TaxID=61016 RepID=UPI00190A11ED|nr:Ldh family oxidoreductase [Virgibacillus salexigens]
MNFNKDQLIHYVENIFKTVGLSSKDSHTVADSLVAANLRGVDSHGVTRVPIYVKRLKGGAVNPRPNIKVIQDNNSTLLVDGDDGMGQVIGQKTIEIGIEKAKKNGGVHIGVTRSSHFGAGAYFVKQGVEEDMITFAMSNAPSTMAPWGGVRPYFGTNPYTFAIPTGKKEPIILDMATSVVARGKIIMAAQNGTDIPTGWAIDNKGQPTTDSNSALKGTVLPFGGPKGYGIAMMIDIMSGVLTGAGFGPHIKNIYGDFDKPQNVGHFFQLIDINTFMPAKLFKRRINQMIDEIKLSPAVEGIDEIFIPGEIEHKMEQTKRKNGIDLSKEVYDDIKKVGADCGVDIRDYEGKRNDTIR